MNPPLRVAVIHEWLATYAGSEKVLEQILILYPEADLFVMVDFMSPGDRRFLNGKLPRTTFIQRLPGARKHFRYYLPFMPLAVEQFDLQGYNLVISSSHAVAKGVITGPDQVHICYCHSPMRYAWDLQHQYLRESGPRSGPAAWAAQAMLHYLRIWDCRTSHGVDAFVANSRYVAGRIRKVYGRTSVVIHPPVDTTFFEPSPVKEGFYFAASRFVSYKRMDLIVRAFQHLGERRLVVIGDGPEFAKCSKLAGPNVTLLGWQNDEILRSHMQRARAFIFAAEEDFGIAPVEAQSCGTPVICFGRGGVLDSVVDGLTGVFFAEQTEQSIVHAVRRFETLAFHGPALRENAERFAPPVFRRKFRALVEARLQNERSAAHAGHGESFVIPPWR